MSNRTASAAALALGLALAHGATAQTNPTLPFPQYMANKTIAAAPFAGSDYVPLLRNGAVMKIPGNKIVTTDDDQTITHKTIDFNNNTFVHMPYFSTTGSGTENNLVSYGTENSLKDSNIGVNARGGLATSQSGTGTGGALEPIVFNKITVSSDDVAVSGDMSLFPHVGGPFHNALSIEHDYGGSNMTGGVNSFVVDSQFMAPTNAGNANRNYTSSAGLMTVYSGDGGVNDLGYVPPNGHSAGGFFGSWSYALALPSAQHLLALQGKEINVAAEAGATGWLKEALALGPESVDAAAFTHNIIMSISGKSTTPTFDTGISFNDFHGASPFTADAALIKVDGHPENPIIMQVSRGIDFRRADLVDGLLDWCSFPTGTTPLDCAAYSYISGRQSRVKLTHDADRDSGGEPTYTGDLRLIGNSAETGTAAANGGVEFKVSNSGSGYGFRIFGKDGGAGAETLILQRRYNSATWSDALYLDAATASVVVPDRLTRLADAAVLTGGDPGAVGDIRLIGRSDAVSGGNGGIEFKSITTGAGTGFRMLADGSTYSFLRRSNNASWTTSFTVAADGTDGVKFIDPINLPLVTAPAAPAAGWVLYTDTATGLLKAKHSTGTEVTIATP